MLGVGGYRETRRDGRLASSRRIRVGSWNVETLIATARNEVGVALAPYLKDKVVHVIRISDRIMLPRLVIEEEAVNVISAYAPQLIIAGDLNSHIGAKADGFSSVHGGFGYEVRNEEGRTILEFAASYDLVVVNSFFKKRDSHLITFHSGDHDTQIDYMLVRRGDLRLCKDCKVFPEATKAFRTRVIEEVTPEAEGRIVADAEQMWNRLANTIKKAAKETLGVVAGTLRTYIGRRESWWISDEVQDKVKVKQTRFRELISMRGEDEANRSATEERIAKARDRRKIDLGNVRFIKEGDGRSIVNEDAIRRRWKEYFFALFNGQRRDRTEEVDSIGTNPQNNCYCSRIRYIEVKEALWKMGRKKAVGPDEIPIEAWRCLGGEGCGG
ncbi:ubiquinol oxidase, mitochondrial-like protein [Tanacetum coccineum]|uniref:Ubiquinol oxidase, mitochondrial-like protein n=1 Tax=Tanacetum coccineum TaxID=301880 RepID=A0ABQ5HQA6_9ASTR